MSIPNLAPADELHLVRSNIKAFEEREKELVRLMKDDPSARMGNSFCARVIEVESSRPDTVAMKQLYPDIVAEFTFPQKYTQVVLDGVTKDGEIVPRPRLRTLRIV